LIRITYAEFSEAIALEARIKVRHIGGALRRIGHIVGAVGVAAVKHCAQIIDAVGIVCDTPVLTGRVCTAIVETSEKIDTIRACIAGLHLAFTITSEAGVEIGYRRSAICICVTARVVGTVIVAAIEDRYQVIDAARIFVRTLRLAGGVLTAIDQAVEQIAAVDIAVTYFQLVRAPAIEAALKINDV
jgi:hypothetical protein